MGNERDNEAWAAVLHDAHLVFFPIHGNGLRRQHRYPPLGVDAVGLRRVWHDATFDPNLRASLDRMGLTPWLGISLRLGDVFDALAAFSRLRRWPDRGDVPVSWRASFAPLHQAGWLFELGEARTLTFAPFVADPLGDGWIHRCGPPVCHLHPDLPPETQGWIDGLGRNTAAVMQAWTLLQQT